MVVAQKIIESVVREVAGLDVIPLVKALRIKKNISEFELAEKMNDEVNATRNRLYRLYDANLVSFVRKKDKKKGWYIYYWTFNIRRINYLMTHLKKKRLDGLNDRLKREKQENFFGCKEACIRLDFEQATNFEFKCPECGCLLEMEDNAPKIEEIRAQIMNLEKEIKTTNPLDFGEEGMSEEEQEAKKTAKINMKKAKKIASVRKKTDQKKTKKISGSKVKTKPKKKVLVVKVNKKKLTKKQKNSFG